MAKSDITKKRVEDALLDILEEKSIDEITVGEFIEYANVSRSTFYRYYHDIYDVYDSMLEKFATKCVRCVELILDNKITAGDMAENVSADWQMKNNSIFTIVDYKFFHQVVYSDMKTTVLTRMYRILSKSFKVVLLDKGVDEEKAEFYSSFILDSLLSLYTHAFKRGREFTAEALEGALRIINNCN